MKKTNKLFQLNRLSKNESKKVVGGRINSTDPRDSRINGTDPRDSRINGTDPRDSKSLLK